MQIERRFTRPGQSAYAEIAFRKAVSEIRNPDGSIVFRADDINRYLVQHIGKIEPYEWHQCSLPAAAHTPGVNGNSYHQQVAPSRELTYGPETSAEHDAESAVVELLSGLAVRSPDVPLALIGGAA